MSVPDIGVMMAPKPKVETLFERALVWEKAKAALQVAQANEAAARDALLEKDFADRVIGTNTKALPDGRLVKCVASLRYSSDMARVKACVAKMKKLANGGLLAERLFGYEPKVMISELKKLPDNMRKLADAAIDLKPARPSIEIVVPERADGDAA